MARLSFTADRFLFCMPLRVGVLVISFLEFAVCTAGAALLWNLVAKDLHGFTVTFKILWISMAVHYTLNTLFSIVGFTGALRRRTVHVVDYATQLAYTVVVQTILSVVFLVLYFLAGSAGLSSLCNESSDTVCNNIVHARAATVVLVIVPLLLEAYAYYIVRSYAVRLETKDHARATKAFDSSWHIYKSVAVADSEAVPVPDDGAETRPLTTYSQSTLSTFETAHHDNDKHSGYISIPV
ncbi:hypothetical protein PLICRDRAFT_589869 [Plicaturopsis crispa FD-325 SS-3]|nr:hypothetical protein PLICRDRAFT_589869 [Plicaturopsis crispa FD-325 SS-3]